MSSARVLEAGSIPFRMERRQTSIQPTDPRQSTSVIAQIGYIVGNETVTLIFNYKEECPPVYPISMTRPADQFEFP